MLHIVLVAENILINNFKNSALVEHFSGKADIRAQKNAKERRGTGWVGFEVLDRIDKESVIKRVYLNSYLKQQERRHTDTCGQ